jgi:conjugal transfer/entry exclusion protein
MTILCLALLLLHHKGPVTSSILHVLDPSDLHLNVLLVQRTVEVLGEDIHTVLLGWNPLDSNEAIFFKSLK